MKLREALAYAKTELDTNPDRYAFAYSRIPYNKEARACIWGLVFEAGGLGGIEPWAGIGDGIRLMTPLEDGRPLDSALYLLLDDTAEGMEGHPLWRNDAALASQVISVVLEQNIGLILDIDLPTVEKFREEICAEEEQPELMAIPVTVVAVEEAVEEFEEEEEFEDDLAEEDDSAEDVD